MNADQLLAHYEKIADAPEAIPRLRRFILDLAVRGKLVPQDPSDEPASELLKRIAKEQLSQTNLPRNWRRATVGALLDFQYGKGLKASERAEEGPVPVYGSNGIVGYTDKPLTEQSSIIVGRKGSAGALNLCNGPSWTTDVAYFVEAPPFFDLRFLLNVLAALDLDRLGKGVKPGLSRADAYEQIMCVPPLAEQHRIVAKVDELMALCDRLEATRAAREATRDRLATASLRLNRSDPDKQAFRDHAGFALDNLIALTTRPDQIKQLRQTILNLAVSGKLVPQDPNDEPAIEFDRKLPADLEPPFDIPASWKWARLHTLGRLKGGGTPSKARDDFWNGNIPWVSPKDMKVDYLRNAQLNITEAAIAGSAANLIESGSILFVVRGMILAHSFPVAVTRVPLAINQDMKALVLKKPEMAEFILRALKGLKSEMLERVQRSSHGTCRLEGSAYSDFFIPIPPFPEQHRIVTKVDELMALCDRLEASLDQSAATRRRLLDALLHAALSPETREREAA